MVVCRYPDEDPLGYSIATALTHWTASVQGDCSTRCYTPDTGFSGSDEFTYQVSDGSPKDAGAVSLIVSVVESDDAFVDDADSIFESDVEWLAAEGITKGCNSPTNDPSAPQTSWLAITLAWIVIGMSADHARPWVPRIS